MDYGTAYDTQFNMKGEKIGNYIFMLTRLQ
jgi:hypothetical protein